MKTAMTAFFAVLLMSGCSTIDSVRPGAGGSTFDIQGKTYSQVWNAAIETVSSQLTIVGANRQTGDIRAEKGVGLATWGEVVGVFIRPTIANADIYTVEVQSLKRSALQITGQNWTNTVVEGIKARLDL